VGNFGGELRSYPLCWPGFTLNWEARAEMGALQCCAPHATNIHTARRGAWRMRLHENGGQRAAYAWRENLLGLTRTMHVATSSGDPAGWWPSAARATRIWTTPPPSNSTPPTGGWDSCAIWGSKNIEAWRSGLGRSVWSHWCQFCLQYWSTFVLPPV
jgi:hypothetical protein